MVMCVFELDFYSLLNMKSSNPQHKSVACCLSKQGTIFYTISAPETNECSRIFKRDVLALFKPAYVEKTIDLKPILKLMI